MSRWLFFVEKCNFEVKYKTGKRNVLNKALSCRPGYELAHVTTLSSPIEELIRVAYRWDSQSVALYHAVSSEEHKYLDTQLSARLRASLHRYYIDCVLLWYRTDAPRIVVSHDKDLKYRILFKAHYTARWAFGPRMPTDGMIMCIKEYSVLMAL